MIETDVEKFEDFIEVYHNVVSPEFCNNTIAHYNALEQTRRAYSRQESEGAAYTDKTGGIAFLTDDPNLQNFDVTGEILHQFHNASAECFRHYAEKFGILTQHQLTMNHNVQLQKTPRTGGYHIWHFENSGGGSHKRALFVQLYLNTIDEGGETEFLYQSKRIPAVQGSMLICPAGFTHTHRGNPPLKGNKFTINSWVEFT